MHQVLVLREIIHNYKSAQYMLQLLASKCVNQCDYIVYCIQQNIRGGTFL